VWVHGINDLDEIVGGDGNGNAYLWRPSGELTALPALSNGGSNANAINNSGDVVGASTNEGGYSEAVFWHNGTVRRIGKLPGHVRSEALSINNIGQVVGVSCPGDDLPICSAFVWTVADGMEDLGSISGLEIADAINDQSLVLGRIKQSWPPVDSDPAYEGQPPRHFLPPATYQIVIQEPANTPAGTDVSVTPVVSNGDASSISMTFSEVVTPGVTTVTVASLDGAGAPAPSGFRIPDSGTFYEVATTATFSGPVELCFSYDDSEFGAESELRLLHYADQTWVDITSTGYPDVVNNRICGHATSFSPFLIGEINQRPSIGSIELPGVPISVGTSVNAIAHFTDPNKRDAHSGTINWGDATETLGTIVEGNGAGHLSASHTFGLAGVYTIQATVSDGSLSGSRVSSSDVPAYIVAYDPSAGYVTGGGWFTSPVGAFSPLPAVTGKATFGFVAKYVKGKTAPEGTTELSFATAQMKFRSTAYEWLVVSGSKANYRGTGTINGSGSYRFLLSAIDGTGADEFDKVRIKIWDDATGSVVYDNQRGAADDTNPSLRVDGGSIVIHK
jgi:probable HAF family extracellular repeat protein